MYCSYVYPIIAKQLLYGFFWDSEQSSTNMIANSGNWDNLAQCETISASYKASCPVGKFLAEIRPMY
jgi:hypothetical protein